MSDHEKPSNRLLGAEEWMLLVEELRQMSDDFCAITAHGSVKTSDMRALWEQMREAVRKYDALRARPVTVMVVGGAQMHRGGIHAHCNECKRWCDDRGHAEGCGQFIVGRCEECGGDIRRDGSTHHLPCSHFAEIPPHRPTKRPRWFSK